VLEQILAGTTANLAGFAERAAADDDHLAELAHETLARLLVGEGIARDAFLNLPLALKRRVLRFWVNRLNPGIELSFDRVEAARLLIERGSGEKMVEIGLGWSVALRRGSIFLISPENQEDGRIGEAMP
jgi:cytosine/adenosine deaminase-related metal-dependent hydrolase